MNILFIINHLNVGGITSYLLTLSKGLKENGHNLYIASSGGELLSKIQELGLIYIPIPIKTKKEISVKIIFSAFKLSGIIKDKKIDIIHSHSRTTQVLGCILARLTGVKHIFTCHGFFKRRLLRRFFPCWGERIIAISEQVKEHLVRDFKAEENKITVIHNGIDTDNFQMASAEQQITNKIKLGLAAGPVIGIIGRLSDIKGHRYLFEAMKIVLSKFPQASLLVVGEGKMFKELTELANNLGIKSSVLFIPTVIDTREVLSAMDIFVMPSLQEGLGLALMEAMASGRAVIGSNVGGIKSLIHDKETGLLVAAVDSQALARAIIELIGDPIMMRKLGVQAQEFIKQNFSQRQMIFETETEYLKCLS